MLPDFDSYFAANRSIAESLRGRTALVLGAGLAGHSIALLLLKAGLSVVIVDRDQHEDGNLTRSYLSLDSVEHPKVRGLHDRVAAELPPEVRVIPVHADILAIEDPWFREVIPRMAFVVVAVADPDVNTLINRYCSELGVNLVLVHLTADEETLGDIFVTPYADWRSRRNRAAGCYECVDHAPRREWRNEQRHDFLLAEAQVVVAYVAMIVLGALSTTATRIGRAFREALDADVSYYVISRVPLHASPIRIERRTSCPSCGARPVRRHRLRLLVLLSLVLTAFGAWLLFRDQLCGLVGGRGC